MEFEKYKKIIHEAVTNLNNDVKIHSIEQLMGWVGADEAAWIVGETYEFADPGYRWSENFDARQILSLAYTTVNLAQNADKKAMFEHLTLLGEKFYQTGNGYYNWPSFNNFIEKIPELKSFADKIVSYLIVTSAELKIKLGSKVNIIRLIGSATEEALMDYPEPVIPWDANELKTFAKLLPKYLALSKKMQKIFHQMVSIVNATEDEETVRLTLDTMGDIMYPEEP